MGSGWGPKRDGWTEWTFPGLLQVVAQVQSWVGWAPLFQGWERAGGCSSLPSSQSEVFEDGNHLACSVRSQPPASGAPPTHTVPLTCLPSLCPGSRLCVRASRNQSTALAELMAFLFLYASVPGVSAVLGTQCGGKRQTGSLLRDK